MHYWVYFFSFKEIFIIFPVFLKNSHITLKNSPSQIKSFSIHQNYKPKIVNRPLIVIPRISLYLIIVKNPFHLTFLYTHKSTEMRPKKRVLKSFHFAILLFSLFFVKRTHSLKWRMKGEVEKKKDCVH